MNIISKIAKTIKEIFMGTPEQIGQQKKEAESISVKKRASLLKKRALEMSIPSLLYSIYSKISYGAKDVLREYGIENISKLEEIEIDAQNCKREKFAYNNNTYVLAYCDYTFYVGFGEGIDHRYVHLFFNDKKVVSLDFNRFNSADKNIYDLGRDYKCENEDDIRGFIEGAWINELRLLEKDIQVIDQRRSQECKKVFFKKETKDLKENFGME